MLHRKENMMQLISYYMQKTLGITVKFKKWEAEEALPLLLREHYSFSIILVFDREHLVFIGQTEERKTATVLAKHIRLIKQFWSGGIIYAKQTLNSTDRARLIQAAIPFIIPNKQLFLPYLGMDLKEIFPEKKPKHEKISPSAQLLVLGKLYNKSWIRENPSIMAEHTGLTNMSLGRAFKELEQFHIATIRTQGKEKFLNFPVQGKKLWGMSLPFLRSPVTSSITIQDKIPEGLICSGETALSRYSLLQEPQISVFATHNKRKLSQLQFNDPEKNSETCSIIQKWAYDPRILAKNTIADPLSVYLEFSDSEDERIEEALENLLKGISW